MLDIVVGDSHSAHGAGGLIFSCKDTIHTLEIRSPFRAEYLPIIASLPHLRKLLLARACFPRDLPSNAFPSLEVVTILRFHGQLFQNFFKHLCTTSLRLVRIYGADTIDFEELMAALAGFSASLRMLEVVGVTNVDLPSAVTPRLFTNLRILSVRCSRLGDSGIHRSCTFRPTDQAIAELGAAMPNINRLLLGNTNCDNSEPVTFLSLVNLSKSCRDLEILHLKVDFQTMVDLSLRSEDVKTGTTFERTQGSPCKLHRLAIGSSILPDHPESDLDRWKLQRVMRNIWMLRQVHRTVQQ